MSSFAWRDLRSLWSDNTVDLRDFWHVKDDVFYVMFEMQRRVVFNISEEESLCSVWYDKSVALYDIWYEKKEFLLA